ncbi:DNA excision repair protein ERCC-8 [Halotydeus destructor]|nr:DNA excision repair protein ERCC-8 [Halotydeus destructor]
MNLSDVILRQYSHVGLTGLSRKYLRNFHDTRSFQNVSSNSVCDKSVNAFDFDKSEQFLLVCENDGTVRLEAVEDEMSGKLKNLQVKRFFEGYANRAQWFPTDTGMFQVAYSRQVKLVDTNSMNVCETHHFAADIFWTDWSPTNPNLIAVGGASSAVRFIDVRSGSSLHQITITSPLGYSSNGATRVLWDYFDSECIFVGDAYGYLHLYDIRNARHSLQLKSSDAVCDDVTCLQFTKDKMHLLSCHGTNCVMNLWTFERKNLVNAHVNYGSAFAKRKNKLTRLSPGYVKYQVFFTDDHVIRPSISGKGVDLIVNDLWNGMIKTTYSTEAHQSRKSFTTAVAGTSSGQLMVSGGRRNYSVWIPKLHD